MKKLILTLVVALIYSFCPAQNDETELRSFEIIIRVSNDNFVLESKKGSAWKKLTFSNEKIPHAIDEFGMTKLIDGQNSRKRSDEQLADFTFSLRREDDKIILKSMQGSAWKELSYDCNDKDCFIRINEMGMM